jgi:hypothetical protein
MNDRIQQLAEQAGFIDRGTNHTAYMNFDHEKFAELIVRECIGIADEYDGVGSTIVGRIEKHFGVEL